MISTKLINRYPVIICHKMSGQIGEAEAVAGSSDAIKVIEDVTSTANEFMLLLDMRSASFTNLKAHREWSIGFKEKELLHKSVSKVALVSDSSSKVENEKELMESETLKYFIKYEDAENWLKSA